MSKSKRQKASKENREEIDILAYPELFREVRRQAVNKLGLNSDKALMACSELCRALTCKGEHEDPMSLSLPPLLDQLWHVALLNTEKYAQFCEESFGHFIHHTTMTDADSVGERNKRVGATVKMYRFLFDTEPMGELWVREPEVQQERRSPHIIIHLTGLLGEVMDLKVHRSTRIEKIISKYASMKQLAAKDLWLAADENPLQSDSTVDDNDIQDHDWLDVKGDVRLAPTGC